MSEQAAMGTIDRSESAGRRAKTEERDALRTARKRKLLFALKLAFSLTMLVVIFQKVVARDGAHGLLERIGNLAPGWLALAVLAQLAAIVCSMVRWQRLLVGQGIHAPWRFLAGSIMIARFWGAFTPGGFTGFGGWRIYDVAKHTGKAARAAAVIGVEMILGQLAFGVVVMSGSIFGLRFIGMEGVLLVNGLFLGAITVGLTFLARPALFLWTTRWLPPAFQVRVKTLADAVSTYGGKSRLLIQAALLGVGTHAFNNLIYVSAAQALGVQLSVGEVFFASSLQILATLLPASINGIGLREVTAVALYTTLGIDPTVAVLIPVVGFACEMFVSAFGGPIFMARRAGYEAGIRVDDADREQVAHAAISPIPADRWPKRKTGTAIGLGAGLLAGLLVGILEGIAVVAGASSAMGLYVVLYGAIAYALFGMVAGGGLGFVLAWSGRLMRREALPENLAYARIVAFLSAGLGFALTAFRIRRDVFAEQLVWKSPKGLVLLLACALAAAILYWILSAVLRRVTARRPLRVMVKAWGSTAVVTGLVVLLGAATLLLGPAAEAAPRAATAPAKEGTTNLLFVVVDTLRADHLPGYGYERGSTPNLDAFAGDAIRFDQAFSNASWTRPSFASLLTGRYASSHGVMHKPDSLPDALVTLPEALKKAGFVTAGFVTNYNVAPYFNFHQGFDHYRYLEPDFVLGADDAAAKLLLVQAARRVVERTRAKLGHVPPGSAYQDAERVTDEVLGWLDTAPTDRPWLMFAGYMDPHDPYYEHPYDGSGYARVAHPTPDPADVPELKRLYDGEISYWDSHFGRLIASLKERGLYDELTIVVTSDHGEEFHDHGGFWHGTTLYDEQVRVPLYVKLPGSRRGGTTVRHWVQSIDLMPTLLREQGIDPPSGIQGGNLFDGSDRVYAEESHEGNVLESIRERRGTDELKLITANPNNPRKLPTVQYFRVDRDPAEQEDLAASDASTVSALMKALVAAGEHAATGAVTKKTVEVDADAAARLKALGYATDEGSE